MKQQLKQEWLSLMQEGAHGQATRFRLRAMRLAQLIRKTDPDLSAVLSSSAAGEGSITRLAPPELALLDAPELLVVEHVESLVTKPYWPKPVTTALQQIVREWKSQDRLLKANLYPTKTLLLYGPPGVGKTLSAKWLAMELGLPLATLDLSATMNSYLGKTGQNLSKVLDYARSNPCVLLLDEFDALAKRRNDDQDVGELKRVVNVLLQSIDQWNGPSLLVAATNHQSLLDQAILRRFEASIEFPIATSQQINQVLKSLGVPGNISTKLSSQLQGQPISNATRIVMSARKREVLSGISFEESLEMVTNEQIGLKPKIEQRRAMVSALFASGKSAHKIARELNISHTTVLRDLKFINEE